MADYHLSCQECEFESGEDQYYVMCPSCGGMLEVILDNDMQDRVVDYSKPSIFKYHNEIYN